MTQNTNFFSKIANLVPGYKGYAEREDRRSNDKVFRDHCSGSLLRSEQDIVNCMNDQIRAGNMAVARQLEPLRKSVNTLASRINFSPYGESGFFAANRIGEQELASIQQMDVTIGDNVKALAAEVTNSYDDTYIKNIQQHIRIIEDALVARNNFIGNYK